MTSTNHQLNAKQVSYLQVTSREIGRFICQVYGISYYDPAVTEEWYSGYHLIVVQKEELLEWDLRKIESVKSGTDKSCSFCSLMTDMCNRGLIEPGDYLIDANR